MQVDGIKTDEKRLEEARKHIKLGQYKQAAKLINTVLENDHFNIETQCLWIENAIRFYELKKDCILYNMTRSKNIHLWNDIKGIIDRYDNLLKIDEDNEYNKYLKEYIEIIEYIRNEYDKLLNAEKIGNDFLEKYKQKAYTLDTFNYVFNTHIKETYNYRTSSTIESLYWLKIIFVERDGTVIVKYKKGAGEYETDPTWIEKKYKGIEITSLDEFNSLIKKCLNRDIGTKGKLKCFWDNFKKGF